MDLPVTDRAAPEGQLSVPPQPDQQAIKDKHRHRSKSKSKHKHKSEKEGKEHRKKRKHRSRSRTRGEAPPPGSAVDQVAQDAAPAAPLVSKSWCCCGNWHQECMSIKHHCGSVSPSSACGKASKMGIIAERWHRCCEQSDTSTVAFPEHGQPTTAIRGCMQPACPDLSGTYSQGVAGLRNRYKSRYGFGHCCTVPDSPASLLLHPCCARSTPNTHTQARGQCVPMSSAQESSCLACQNLLSLCTNLRGVTLQKANVHNIFCSGQLSTALSRVQEQEDVCIIGNVSESMRLADPVNPRWCAAHK